MDPLLEANRLMRYKIQHFFMLAKNEGGIHADR